MHADQSRQEPAAILFKQLRTNVGWTQRDAATILGVSQKAVESYDQGWRRVPDSIWRQMLTILSVQVGYPRKHKPCWDVNGCSRARRKSCFCARTLRGHFCWLVAAKSRCPRWQEHLGAQSCLTCGVVKAFLPAAAPKRRAARKPVKARRAAPASPKASSATRKPARTRRRSSARAPGRT